MITELISTLDSSAIKAYTTYLKNRGPKKLDYSSQLFKAFVKGNQAQLKAEWGNNRFAVTKKRVTDNLKNFISEYTLENEAQLEISCIKRLFLARRLIRFNHYSTAYELLEKLLQLTHQTDLYSIRNEIFSSMVECSEVSQNIDQEQLIKNYEANIQQHEHYELLQIAKAKVKRNFVEAEYLGKELDIEAAFLNYKNSVEQIQTTALNFKDLYSLVQVADAQSKITKNYAKINLFFVDEFRKLEQLGISKTQRVFHIKLLYLISNIYFRKKDFETSLNFLKEMKESIETGSSIEADSFEHRYISLLALNFNFLGNFKRASLLVDQCLIQEKLVVKDKLNLVLIRSMIAFQQNDYKRTAKLFAQFQESDKQYENVMGKDWLLNMKFIEILLHIELDNIDFVDARIQSLVKKYGVYLKERSDFQVLPFLKLVRQVIKNPGLVITEKFHQKVEKQLSWKESSEEDLFLMCFYAWLKSKMFQQPIYDVTLELVKS